MNDTCKCVNIACSDEKTAKALARYLKYCINCEEIIINPLDNPYKVSDAIKMAAKCDLLSVDSYFNDIPRGFQFAKRMQKKTLLLFYLDEISIERVGEFWITLPQKITELKEVIRKVLYSPPVSESKFIDLETRYPRLTENRNHHT
jgi:hypothetical protein